MPNYMYPEVFCNGHMKKCCCVPFDCKYSSCFVFICSKPLSLDAREGFVYLHIFALDDESFDLLRELDNSIQFIDSARNCGAVIVHW